jgi:hypothetical protein
VSNFEVPQNGRDNELRLAAGSRALLVLTVSSTRSQFFWRVGDHRMYWSYIADP